MKNLPKFSLNQMVIFRQGNNYGKPVYTQGIITSAQCENERWWYGINNLHSYVAEEDIEILITK